MTYPEQTPNELDTVSYEDITISDTWETLCGYQRLIDEGTDPEVLAELIGDAADKLSEVLGDKVLNLDGTLLIPSVEMTAIRLDVISKVSGNVRGIVNSISVIELPDESTGPDPRNIIGIKLNTGKIKVASMLIEGSLNQLVFCPINETTIALIEDGEQPLVPDLDDSIAQDIDSAVLNEKIDFSQLVEIFQSADEVTGRYLSSIELQMYLTHLNSVGSFGHITALAPEGLLINDETIESHNPPSDGYLLSGKFAGFMAIDVEDELKNTQTKLVVCALDDAGNKVGIFVDEIVDIQLK